MSWRLSRTALRRCPQPIGYRTPRRTLLPAARAVTVNVVGEAVASLSEPQMGNYGTALPVVEQMEGAAVAAVCRELETEYMHLRAISNHVGDKRSEWRVAEAVEALGAAAAAMDE